MHKFLFSILVMLSAVLFAACGQDGGNGNGGGGGEPGTSILLASGGAGFTAEGGTGGKFSIETTGSSRVLISGTVDADFVISAITPTFGTNPVTISSGTYTVQLNADAASDGLSLYTKTGDSRLFLGNGDGKLKNDPVVTGLTVGADAALILVDQNSTAGYGSFTLEQDLLVEGTVSTNAAAGLYIEANLIEVGDAGRIITSAGSPDSDAKQIHLGGGTGHTKKIINRGTIEARGSGSGNGGGMHLIADDLVVNYGTLDTSGGSSDTGKGGDCGQLEVIVNYGNFYSSGTVRASGGDGGNGPGGNGGAVIVKTALQDSTETQGDIVISGTWQMNGGNGMNGTGGYGASIGFETAAMGDVFMNLTLSVRGGNSLRSSPLGTAYSGGNGGSLSIQSSNASSSHIVTPGRVLVAGHLDLGGGDGEESGGSGGSVAVSSRGGNAGHKGVDVEFVGFTDIVLNGGIGVTQGGNASAPAFKMAIVPPEGNNLITVVTGDGAITFEAKVILNEAFIQAKGGNASGTGGMGGSVVMNGITSNKPWNKGSSKQPATPASKSVNGMGSIGDIDVSGGSGEIGGSAYNLGDGAIYCVADGVYNIGHLAARGGNGTTKGGNGGNIVLRSLTVSTDNDGTADTAGGTGGTTTPGSFYIDGMAM